MRSILYVLLRRMGTPSSFSAMFSKGDNFHDFLFAYMENENFKMGSILKRKNTFQGEQILAFMR